MDLKVENRNIGSDVMVLPTPQEVKEKFPASDAVKAQVVEHRRIVEAILAKKDRRLMAIVGPCSIHDIDSAYEYADKLMKVHGELLDQFFIIMRAFMAKPRTTTGWKGLFYDPHLDGSSDIITGAFRVRKIALSLVELGLPIATEVLDPFMIQYIDDLVSWTAIGARTSESQTHREIASGLSAPVGIKNSTGGDIRTAIDGITSANHSHRFWGMGKNGRVEFLQGTGNPWAHLVLRGGSQASNYERATMLQAVDDLKSNKLLDSIVIDCSHGNSIQLDEHKKPKKDFRNQIIALDNIVTQRQNGLENIVGFMLESHLKEGNQKLSSTPTPEEIENLEYGRSITDACLGFEATEEALRSASERLQSLVTP